MRLSKAILIKSLKPTLEKLGYTLFKIGKDDWQGLFCKKIQRDLYITLGLTIHRYYNNAFTADFYLSKNTMIGVIWGDIPKEIYTRPGFLLSEDERSIYNEKGVNVDSSKDIWWDGSDKQSVSDFLKVIELVESRLINTPTILHKLEQSEDLKKLLEYSEAVKRIVSLNKKNNNDGIIHSININELPQVWIEASEIVLREGKEVINQHTIQRLASDAYRQFQLSSLSPCNP